MPAAKLPRSGETLRRRKKSWRGKGTSGPIKGGGARPTKKALAVTPQDSASSYRAAPRPRYARGRDDPPPLGEPRPCPLVAKWTREDPLRRDDGERAREDPRLLGGEGLSEAERPLGDNLSPRVRERARERALDSLEK